MTDIIAFPTERTRRARELQRDAQLQEDPYYLFVKNVMSIVHDCGFALPNTVEACAQTWFDKNRQHSPLAKNLAPSDKSSP